MCLWGYNGQKGKLDRECVSACPELLVCFIFMLNWNNKSLLVSVCVRKEKSLSSCVLFNGVPSSSFAKQGSTEHGNLSHKMSSGISSQRSGGRNKLFFFPHDPIF